MATRYWTGRQQILPASYLHTITAANGAVYTWVINGRSFAYTNSANLTATAIATALAALVNSVEYAETEEHTITSSGATVTVTGPSDGTPVTSTSSSTAGAFSQTTAVNAKSPSDLSDAANWDTAPVANDTAVFPVGTPPVLHGLDAWDELAVNVVRLAGGPQIGLPSIRPNGRVEHRQTHLQTEGTTISLGISSNDGFESVRIDSVGTESVIVSVVGSANGFSDGAVSLRNLAASSAIRIVNAGCVVDGTCALAEVRSQDSRLRLEPLAGVTSLLTYGGVVVVQSAFTTWTIDGGCDATAAGTAAGTPIVDSGTLAWNSSGTITNAVVSAEGALTTAGGSAVVTVSGSITLASDTAGLDDSGERFVKPYVVKVLRSQLAPGSRIQLGRHLQIEVDAYS